MSDRHADIHGAIQTLLDLPEGERLGWLLQQYPDDPAVRERLLAAIGGSAHDQAAVPDVPFVFAAPNDSVPARIGRYEILRSLGSGGMGTVLLAHDPELRRDVALKCLRVKFGSEQSRQRFRREARAAAQLRHPNIVTIFDIYDDGPQPVIAMEYIPGHTLAELIEEQRALTLERKLEILEALCAGLDCAHKSGVLHRDIKPANVMVDTGGHVKVLDFGVAKLVDSPILSTEITSEQMVIGTPGYIAPEHLTGADVTVKSDLFSTAVVAYEFLTYRKPFGETRGEIAQRILGGTVPPMMVDGRRLPSSIERAVRKGLALSPSDRQDDAAALRQAFAKARIEILRQEGGASDESNEGQSEMLTWASAQAGDQSKSRLPLFFAIGVSLAFVGGLWVYLSGDRPLNQAHAERTADSPPPLSPATATIPAPSQTRAPGEPRRGYGTRPSAVRSEQLPQGRPVADNEQRSIDVPPPSVPVLSTPPPDERASTSRVENGTRGDVPAASAPAPRQPVTSASNLEQEIRGVLQQLERAYAQRSAVAIRELHPSLSPGELAALDRSFIEASSYQLEFGRMQMAAPQGDSVKVLVDMRTIITPLAGEVRNVSSTGVITLQRKGAAWVIVSMQIR